MMDFFKGLYRRLRSAMNGDHLQKEYTALINVFRSAGSLGLSELNEIEEILKKIFPDHELLSQRFQLLRRALRSKTDMSGRMRARYSAFIADEFDRLAKKKVDEDNDVSYFVNGNVIYGDVKSEEEEDYFTDENVAVLNSRPLRKKNCDFDCSVGTCEACIETRLRREIANRMRLKQEGQREERERKRRHLNDGRVVNELNAQLGCPLLIGRALADERFCVDDLDSNEREEFLDWQEESRRKVARMDKRLFVASQETKEDTVKPEYTGLILKQETVEKEERKPDTFDKMEERKPDTFDKKEVEQTFIFDKNEEKVEFPPSNLEKPGPVITDVSAGQTSLFNPFETTAVPPAKNKINEADQSLTVAGGSCIPEPNTLEMDKPRFSIENPFQKAAATILAKDAGRREETKPTAGLDSQPVEAPLNGTKTAPVTEMRGQLGFPTSELPKIESSFKAPENSNSAVNSNPFAGLSSQAASVKNPFGDLKGSGLFNPFASKKDSEKTNACPAQPMASVAPSFNTPSDRLPSALGSPFSALSSNSPPTTKLVEDNPFSSLKPANASSSFSFGNSSNPNLNLGGTKEGEPALSLSTSGNPPFSNPFQSSFKSSFVNQETQQGVGVSTNPFSSFMSTSPSTAQPTPFGGASLQSNPFGAQQAQANPFGIQQPVTGLPSFGGANPASSTEIPFGKVEQQMKNPFGANPFISLKTNSSDDLVNPNGPNLFAIRKEENDEGDLFGGNSESARLRRARRRR